MVKLIPNSIRIGILIVVSAMLAISCDWFQNNDTTVNVESGQESLILNEILYPLNTDLTFKADFNAYDYTLSISTLREKDAKLPYKYNRYELVFPQEVIDLANGKTWVRSVSFTTNESVNDDAAFSSNGEAITRIARMYIPATETAFEMALQQLAQYPGSSFAQDLVVPDPDDDEVDLNRWTCVEIWVELNCQHDDDGNLINCRVTRAVCDVWELISPGDGQEGGGGSNGGDGDDNQGGGGSSNGEDEDPCDPFGNGDNGDGNGDGHDHDEGFHGGILQECEECELPNPPAWCPDDEDDEEEEEFELTCDNVSEAISMLTDQGIISDLEQESGFHNSDHSQRNELLLYTFIDNEGNITRQPVALRPADLLPDGWSLQYSSCHYFGRYDWNMLDQAAFLSHTHPYLPSEQITDLRCYDAPALSLPDTSAANPAWQTYRPGPSAGDRNIVARTKTPMITLDKSNIYVTIPDSTAASGYIDCDF